MLTVVTWLWGNKFGLSDVAKLAAGVRRNLRQPHRFICATDKAPKIFFATGIESVAIDRADYSLLASNGCFARLRSFDPLWQKAYRITDRLVCIDLDTVITGPLDPLFDRPEPFVIMQGGNASNPCPFNGALMLLRAGVHPEVWSDFSVAAATKTKFHSFPDDQGWLWHKLPDAAGWKTGPEHGVYVYRKPGWPGGTDLPEGARLVTFINKTPKDIAHLDWVKEHWHE